MTPYRAPIIRWLPPDCVAYYDARSGVNALPDRKGGSSMALSAAIEGNAGNGLIYLNRQTESHSGSYPFPVGTRTWTSRSATIAHGSAVNPGTGDFTIEVSFYLFSTPLTSASYEILEKQPASGNFIQLFWRGVDQKLVFEGGPLGTVASRFSVSTTTTITGPGWYHLVLVRRNAAQPTIYINGTASALTNERTTWGADTSNTTDWKVFAGNTAGSFWPAYLGVVGMWNRALSSTEAAQLYRLHNDRPLRDLCIAHLSDIHVGYNLAQSNETKLRSVLTAIFAAGIRPDVWAFTGDVLDEREGASLATLSARFVGILNEYGIPLDRVEIIPGNHDHAVVSNMATWSAAFAALGIRGTALPRKVPYREYDLIFLDSGSGGTTGAIGSSNLTWLASNLSATRPSIVCCHHPVAGQQIKAGSSYYLTDRSDFLTALAAGNVLLTLSGHDHSVHDLYLDTTGILMAQALNVGTTWGMGPGYRVIELYGDRVFTYTRAVA